MDSESNRADTVRMVFADWVFLAVLGVLTACLSSTIDTIVVWFQQIQEWSINMSSEENFTGFVSMYTAWVLFFTLMIVTSATLVHYIAPQAIGSGLPEMKTIIRGVILKDYLTFRTLLSKVVGLIFSLGSGAPIGKMGPFVHISSILANQLCLFAARFDRAFGSESRRIETLTAACAIGVACTFSAPVGGVLFSIEVTTMYFSVRNYWRGFFGACCAATTIRLLKGVFAETEVTTSAFFQTYFPKDPYSVDELPLFAFLGIICGFLAASYISIYKHLVLFLRTSQFAKNLFQKRWMVYPVLVSVLLGGLTFPHGLGQFFVGRLRFARNLRDFYLNCTFAVEPGSALACNDEHNCPFIDSELPVNIMLLLFIVALFVLSIVSITLPIPGGVFMPTIVLGAAIGRLMGEITSEWAPNGIDASHFIFPGVYAVAGSAAFSGAVTHSVSVSVVVFEATGQLHCLLPVMIAVIIANAISTYFQPSFFDTIIKIKHLPFLPDIPPSSNIVHTVTAEKMMTSPVRFLCRVTKYEDIRKMLTEGPQLRMFPVVDGANTQMLLGTVNRRTLLEILEEHVGDEARKCEAETRVRRAIETIDKHFKNTQEITTSDPEITVTPEEVIQRRTFSEGMKTLPLFRASRSISPQQRVQFGSSISGKPDITRKCRFVVTAISPEPSTSHASSAEFTFSGSETGSEKNPHSKNSLRKISSTNRRNAFCSMEQKEHEETVTSVSRLPKSESFDSADQHLTIHSLHSFHVDYQKMMKGYLRQAKKAITHLRKQSRKESSQLAIYGLTGIEREEWEHQRMSETFVFPEEFIDPAPFQLVRRTTLFKIHSIFSMLQLTKAYVTECGRLIGVVALCDVRRALEKSSDLAKDLSNDLRPPHHKDSDFREALKDVLTPAIEVIKPNMGRRGSKQIHFAEDDLENVFSKRPTSLRIRTESTGVEDFPIASETRRKSLGQSENLVDAVVYLRRKSMHVSRRRQSKVGPESVNEQKPKE
ncbi:unnamed protein product, partial [Mesorhabditis belari]|uniref:Chloride channel protein n=1 Tax=Mesorhabditis belari TaxID=2138241 RepID=A0AAF3ETE2_9BILA